MSSYHCSSYLFFSNSAENQSISMFQIFNNWLFKIDYISINNSNLPKTIKLPKSRSTWFPIK
nr:hypothetical protein [Megavirus caiporensis]